MRLLVVVIFFVSHIYACNVPVAINSNEATEYHLKGCSKITNATFPNAVVRSLEIIQCSSEQLTEVPKSFISALNELKQLLIKCSVERIKPGAFSDLQSLINLDLSGNKLRSIEEGIFQSIPSLMYLNISYNAIVLIEDKAFGNMPRLADLDLGHNGLDYLKGAWFTNTTSIEELYLNNNFLKEIPSNIFSGWTTAYAFNFDYNRITSIRDGAFAHGPEEINYLTLHHNELTTVNGKAFDAPIKQLDISSNLLVDLPLDLLQTTINVKHIWMFGNPFECSCLRNLERALQDNNVAIMKPVLQATCRGHDDVPVCGVTAATITNTSYSCNGTATDTRLVDRMTKHLRKLGFLDLKDWYEQCSVLTRKTYLET